MEELENIAQRAFYMLVGGTVMAAEGMSQFLEELPHQIQEIADEAIARGEATYQSWEQESNNYWNDDSQLGVSSTLRQQLYSLVNGDWSLAERLLEQARVEHPHQTETWYYEKVIYDLERDR